MEHLETVEAGQTGDRDKPLRMTVQQVNRSNLDSRGFFDQIATGAVKPGKFVEVFIDAPLTEAEARNAKEIEEADPQRPLKSPFAKGAQQFAVFRSHQ